jgi:hypothetical protein
VKTPDYIERMRGRRVIDVARMLGHEVRESAGKPSIVGCPNPKCRAAKRHTKSGDKRGAIFVLPDGTGWWCVQCEERGDSIAFVALDLDGTRDPIGPQAREWMIAYTGAERVAEREKPLPKYVAAPTPAPRYPPTEEVLERWQSTQFVTRLKLWTDEEWREAYPLHESQITTAEKWLLSKRINPTAVRERDLARVCCRLHTWGRLIVPLFDVEGVMRSMIYRSVKGEEPKSLFIKGYERRGLCFGVIPTTPTKLIIVEGEKKYLQHVANETPLPDGTSCIGIESGAWTDAHAARLADGSSVIVRTDPDKQGASYATHIRRTLEDRVNAGTIRLGYQGLTFNRQTGRVEVRK